MSSKLAGLKNAARIERLVSLRVAAKQWRSETEKEAAYELEKNERNRKPDLIAYIRDVYDAAGAGHAGRFQS